MLFLFHRNNPNITIHMSRITNMNNLMTRALCTLMLFLAGFVAVSAQEKMLFGTDHIPELKLTIRQSNWMHVLDSMKLQGEGMIVGSAEIDGVKYPNVGIRYRGQSSYTYSGDKNPYQLELNYIHPDQNHQGYRSLTLSNALRDPSYLREYLGFSIAGEYMKTPKANFIHLYVNNEYAGIYVGIEPVDADFLNRRLGDAWTALFKCSPEIREGKNPEGCKQNTFGNLEYEEDANCYLYNYNLKEGEGWSDLIELTRILQDEPQNIGSVLDVDAVLWMHAFNNMTANLSSYSGQLSSNYYLIRDANGLFHPVIWDLNLAFGSFKNTGQGSDLSMQEMTELDPFLQEGNVTKPLISQLLKDELYKKIYIAHMRQLMKEHFKRDAFRKVAESKHAVILPFIKKEKNRYYSDEDIKNSLDKTIGTRSNIPGLVSFMEDRVNYLKRLDAFTVVEPIVLSADVAKRKKYDDNEVSSFTISVIADKLPKRVHLYYRFREDQPFTELLMEPKPDDKLEDGQGRFVSRINPSEGDTTIEYYVLAENTAAVSFYPSDYRQKPIRIALEDLN